MSERRIAVFFYGLFMDPDALRQRGVHPTDVRRGCVQGFELRIGQRATLVPDSNSRVHGMLMSLSHDEIDRLYAEPSVSSYRPEAVGCELEDGSRAPALCFNLTEPPSPHERNAEYAERLRGLARRLELPASYVDGIG
jgi:hypothetical protein